MHGREKDSDIILTKAEMSRYIYPNILVENKDDLITLKTSLRKQHDGVWYLWDIVKYHQFTISPISIDFMSQIINDFHKQAYLALVLGKIDKSVLDFNGQPCFSEDEDQRSEEERLILTYKN